MSTLPLLPDLPPVSDEAGAVPASSRNPLGFALPLLGAFALSRGGGGAEGLMEGLARGLQLGSIMRERQEATAQRKTLIEEQRAERRAALRRGLLSEAVPVLGRIDDPEEFAQAIDAYRRIGTEFGIRPEEWDVHKFSEAKRTRARQRKAKAVWDALVAQPGGLASVLDLIDRKASVTFEGQEIPIRELRRLAEEPVAKEQVTRPVIEERPGPEVTGTGPGLAQAGLPQRIQVGEETITEEVRRVPARVPTLADLDPRLKPFQSGRLSAPVTRDGHLDTPRALDAVAKALEQAGIANPLREAKDRIEEYDKEFNRLTKRIEVHHKVMDNAETPEQFRKAVSAWDSFVAGEQEAFKKFGYRFTRIDAARATAEWVADQRSRRRGRGEGFVTEEGRPAAGRYRLMRGVRGGQAILDTQTNIRLTFAQAQERARREGDHDLARLIGIPLSTVPEAIPGSLPESIAQAEAQKATLRNELLTAADPKKYAQIAQRIEALDARIHAIKRKERRGSGIDTSVLPPAPSRPAAAIPAAVPSTAPPAKRMTRAELAAIAQTKRISLVEAQRQAEAQGYRIVP